MANFEQIKKARTLLGLGDQATLAHIKAAYRKLSLKYHPDRCKDKEKKNCEKMFKKITTAYKLIMDYCGEYEYSFKQEDVEKEDMDKEFQEHIHRFYDGF